MFSHVIIDGYKEYTDLKIFKGAVDAKFQILRYGIKKTRLIYYYVTAN